MTKSSINLKSALIIAILAFSSVPAFAQVSSKYGYQCRVASTSSPANEVFVSIDLVSSATSGASVVQLRYSVDITGSNSQKNENILMYKFSSSAMAQNSSSLSVQVAATGDRTRWINYDDSTYETVTVQSPVAGYVTIQKNGKKTAAGRALLPFVNANRETSINCEKVKYSDGSNQCGLFFCL